MPKRRKYRPDEPAIHEVGGLVPEPGGQPRSGNNVEMARLVTTVGLLGEALAASLAPEEPSAPPDSFAQPADNPRPAFFEEFAGLMQIVGQIERWLAEDPRRGELLGAVREACFDGTPMRALFRRLFPGQCQSQPMEGQARPVLSEREVEVLREMCRGLTQKEVGERLSITPGTVHRHLTNIYVRLGVRDLLPAIGRAVVLGYLEEMEALGIAANCGPYDFGGQGPLVHRVDSVEEPDTATFKPLAEFGLLLMTMSGVAGSHRGWARGLASFSRSLVGEWNRQGAPLRTFTVEGAFPICCLAIAPLSAARHGFTPGNLFLVSSLARPEGLNTCAVFEYTPEGQCVRTFFGGRDIETRLGNVACLAFLPDGRLLMASNSVTDTLLAFSDGGRMVRPFAGCCCNGIAASADGKVYAVRYSSVGCGLNVYDVQGRLLRTLGGTPTGVAYCGIAVDSRGQVFVNRYDESSNQGRIEVFDAEGDFLRIFDVPGLEDARLAMDAQDRLYVPCPRTQDIKIVSSSGKIERRIELPGLAHPYCLAVQENGRLWVSGRYAITQQA